MSINFKALSNKLIVVHGELINFLTTVLFHPVDRKYPFLEHVKKYCSVFHNGCQWKKHYFWITFRFSLNRGGGGVKRGCGQKGRWSLGRKMDSNRLCTHWHFLILIHQHRKWFHTSISFWDVMKWKFKYYMTHIFTHIWWKWSHLSVNLYFLCILSSSFPSLLGSTISIVCFTVYFIYFSETLKKKTFLPKPASNKLHLNLI